MDRIEQGQESVPEGQEKRRRRRYTSAQKLAIVRECLVPRASLAGVALAHGANANMVRKWVVKFQRGGFAPASESSTGLLPVVVKRAAVPQPANAARPTLEIEMSHGVVRFYGALDAVLLAPFVRALTGR
jgi:transposase-like protein